MSHHEVASGQIIVERYKDFTSDSFSHNSSEAVPVVICARNEELDLPSTLLSLAVSEVSIWPVVIDNGSLDDTSRIAKTMGATVFREEKPGKHAAFKHGLEAVLSETTPDTPILTTDADTQVNPAWAAYLSHLLSPDKFKESGGLVFGISVFTRGESFLTDCIRTAALNFKQLRSRLEQRPPGARGHNMALRLTSSSLEAVNNIPDNTFPGQDRAVRDVLVEQGALAFASLHPNSRVYTKGDRYARVADYLAVACGKKSSDDFYTDNDPTHSLVPYQKS